MWHRLHLAASRRGSTRSSGDARRRAALGGCPEQALQITAAAPKLPPWAQRRRLAGSGVT